jgi:lycopene cyclase domain-containing protein
LSYTVMAGLGVVAAVLVDLGLLRTNLLLRKAFWTAYGIVLFFQLIVNGVLTGLPVVRYDRAAITGVRIVNAPIEDLLFGFAMVLLTLATWVRLGARAARTPPRSGPGRPHRPAG